jgi:hypothetical protein
MIIKERISIYDIIGYIADVQTCYTENVKKLMSEYGWKVPDMRLQVFLNSLEVISNARFGVGLMAFAQSNGVYNKDWWETWTLYDKDRAFKNWPDFKTFVDAQCRQYLFKIRELWLVTVQIFTESFLRSLARQLNLEREKFWMLKRDFLQGFLNFSDDDLVPFTVYQHLRNTLHNKGCHYNEKYPQLDLDINGYKFKFEHGQAAQISWEHIRELQIGISNLLLRINEHPKVNCLSPMDDKNIVVINDEDE